ncbi:amino acid adenylation domain-containing protein [Ancylothrix sp. C2]|uniref:non-ribosomal peptide synthetase n=1 Tax=Ancylothrix sp. D3o TaxID=2953691 RepID=UPI0021BA7FA5|nr:amino acid adenylation domain-containing protein [Ancylothrix sp. D3o]MCT7951957.1 amino acid adenylation domain-containing protein [Ancylothrix sp. D3o]
MNIDTFKNDHNGNKEQGNFDDEEREVFVFPASFAQQRLWFFDQLTPANSFYNVSTILRLTGPLNSTVLEQTFNEIISRHEALRTTFAAIEGEPMQIISPRLNIPLKILNLQELPKTERESKAKKLAELESEQPFNLATGPLIRTSIIQLEETENILLLSMHHIISDDWSVGVLIRELGTIYKALAENQPSPLPELPLQYADFSEWQRDCLQGEKLETLLAYWRQQLKGISVLNLPTDRPKTHQQTYQGASQFLELPKKLTDDIKALAKQENVSLFMILLAAFQVLLYRYTGQEDIAIGTPVANRNQSEIESLIGFFVNSLVLRTNLAANPTFKEILASVREVTLDAYAHQDLPFEKLVEYLHPERSLNRHPLFQVVFSLQNAPMETLELPELTLNSLTWEAKTTRFDLELHLWEPSDSFRSIYGEKWQHLDSLRGVAVYSTDLFDEATIQRMLEHYKNLLKNIIINPHESINNLAFLSQAEQHQLLTEWNNTQTNYPEYLGVNQLFEKQVKKNPDKIAINFDNQKLTYQELNNLSNKLAAYLQKMGVKPEVIVGICAEACVNTIVGILGILKAGGAYLLLDPNYPAERLKLMREDAQVSLLLGEEKQIERFKDLSIPVVCLDKDWEIFEQQEINFIVQDNLLKSDNLAYIIYTSGSTGKPKGVAVTHKAINRLVVNTNYIKIDATDKIAQAANLCFDAATFEIWGALLNGAELVGINQEILLSPHDFAAEIRAKKISFLFLTTALFQEIARNVPQAFESLRCLLFGGERVDVRWVKKVLKAGAPQELIHVYGPTENTTFTSYYPVESLAEESTSLPIGRPISNTQIYILDQHLNPVPIGIAGEVYIGGEGLAKGYINRPELTAEKFISLNLPENKQSRVYKTGDIARYLPDGNIEFLGRADNQVKIRGFRIELGEIESILNQHPDVQNAAVIVREEIPGEKNLVGYIVTHQKGRHIISELREFLKAKLPAYMIPSSYAILESLPLTPSGKINRQLLPKIDAEPEDFPEDYVAPRTSVEEKLVKIWANILGKKQVSVYDNFFELGGHSLLATQLISRIRNSFEIELPLSHVFEAPTVASLAKYIEAASWITKSQKIANKDAREEVQF